METVKLKLEGKKTYISVILLFVLGGLKAIGVIDDNLYEGLLPIIGGLTAFGIRSALNRV